MDPSDNRWSNLREATPSQNCANKSAHLDSISGIKGVHWDKRQKKWVAQIGVGGKKIFLGLFNDPHEAALAYATTAYGVRGEFARPHWRALLADMRGVR
jgi:hypothetical protein